MEDFTSEPLGAIVRGLEVRICPECGRRGLYLGSAIDPNGKRTGATIIHSGRPDTQQPDTILIAVDSCAVTGALVRVSA